MKLVMILSYDSEWYSLNPIFIKKRFNGSLWNKMIKTSNTREDKSGFVRYFNIVFYKK